MDASLNVTISELARAVPTGNGVGEQRQYIVPGTPHRGPVTVYLYGGPDAFAELATWAAATARGLRLGQTITDDDVTRALGVPQVPGQQTWQDFDAFGSR